MRRCALGASGRRTMRSPNAVCEHFGIVAERQHQAAACARRPSRSSNAGRQRRSRRPSNARRDRHRSSRDNADQHVAMARGQRGEVVRPARRRAILERRERRPATRAISASAAVKRRRSRAASAVRSACSARSRCACSLPSSARKRAKSCVSPPAAGLRPRAAQQRQFEGLDGAAERAPARRRAGTADA